MKLIGPVWHLPPKWRADFNQCNILLSTALCALSQPVCIKTSELYGWNISPALVIQKIQNYLNKTLENTCALFTKVGYLSFEWGSCPDWARLGSCHCVVLCVLFCLSASPSFELAHPWTTHSCSASLPDLPSLKSSHSILTHLWGPKPSTIKGIAHVLTLLVLLCHLMHFLPLRCLNPVPWSLFSILSKFV